MLARVPWGSLPELLGSPAALQAMGLSLLTSVCATLLALALGVPLAFVLARCSGLAGTFFRGIVLVPMVLPPVVAGLALLAMVGGHRLVGGAPSEGGDGVGLATFAVRF